MEGGSHNRKLPKLVTMRRVCCGFSEVTALLLAGVHQLHLMVVWPHFADNFQFDIVLRAIDTNFNLYLYNKAWRGGAIDSSLIRNRTVPGSNPVAGA